jgi:hypothetical protein
MSWFFRDPRLIVLALALVLAADVPAVISGVPIWLGVFLGLGTVLALTRALILWRRGA